MIELKLNDCMNIMKQYSNNYFDLAIVDPPYGISTKKIACKEVDHHKIDYDTAASDNPFVLAYTHLKTNGSLSSVADA